MLGTRGSTKYDHKFLQRTLGVRKAKTAKTTARRVYELFKARGLPLLYAVTFIRPTHLTQLSEEEFHEQLLPEARRLSRSEEMH